MHRFSHFQTAMLTAGIVSLVAVYVHLSWLALLIELVVGGVLLPVTRMGIAARLMLLIALVASLNTLIGLVFWALKLPLYASTLLVIFAVLICAAGVMGGLRPNMDIRRRNLLPGIEMVALVAALVAGFLVCHPLLTARDTPALMQMVGSGVDNIAHLNYVRLIEGHHDYLYGQGGKSPVEAQLGRGSTAYPQGYHLNEALLNDVLKPADGPRDVHQSLLLYIIVSAAWLASLVFWFVYLSAIVARRFVARRYEPVTWAVAAVAGLYIIVSQLLPLYADGFQPQVAGLSLLLTLCVLLEEFRLASGQRMKTVWAVAALTVVAGIDLFYLYLWPVAIVLTAVVLAWNIRVRTYRPTKNTLACLAALAVMSAAQAVVHITYAHSSISKLDDSGGTLMLNDFLLIGVVAAGLAYVGVRKQRLEKAGSVVVGLILAAGFSLTVLLFQKLTAPGPPSYYYFKSTYTVLLFAAVLLVAAVAQSIAGLKDRPRILLACAVLPLLAWADHSAVLEVYLGKAPFGFEWPIAATTDQLLNDPRYKTEPTKVISIGNNCLNADDLRLTRLVMTLSGQATAAQEEIAGYSFAPAARPEAYRLIHAYQLRQKDKKLIIVTATPAVRQAIIAEAGPNAARLTFINPYTGVAVPPAIACAL